MDSKTINDSPTVQGGGSGAVLANRYRIVRQLGQGGMGSVWLAEDTQLDGKQFAIKMLPSILVSNKRAYRQLKDEALVAMKLTHPNIVTLRAFEENNGNPFLVMDYIDGQTLDDYLADKGTLGEDEVIGVLRPIAAALDYAHGEGVVHRDVKPANVMIRKDGHPFILDFGIAREIQETLTRVTGKLSSGTLLYMSPEQLNGDTPKKEQDIYSFAAMAYECLKGEPPFVRGAIEDQIKNKQPDPPPGGTQLVASVMAGLAKKPADRPESCAAVLEGKDSNRVERAERVEGNVSRRDAEAQSGGADAPRPPQDNGGVRRPAEPIGARVPRDRTGESRPVATVAGRRDHKPSRVVFSRKRKEGVGGKGSGIGKVLGILALFALLAALGGVGAWYYQQQQEAVRREHARITAERKAQAEEAKRKAEEKRLEAAQKAAKAEAAQIRIEALVQQGKVSCISDEDGFKARKVALADVFTRAEALFDEKTKRWSEAAQGFSNYVAQGKALIALDGERGTASEKRAEAVNARSRAVKAEAEKYAPTRWGEAVKLHETANGEFGRMEFASAKDTFGSVARQFILCADEAKAERERTEAAAKAERERQEAAAKEKSEREARERERRAKWRQEGRQFTVDEPYGFAMTMKWCPAGTFTMGSPSAEEGRYDDEVQHQVTLTKGFWMGETEVTQGQWRKIMDGETVVDLVRKGLQDDTIYNIGGKQQTLRQYLGMDRNGDPMNRCGDLKDDVPVYYVSWNEAVEFCRRLTQRERTAGRIPDGYEYRLSTEAEWEYACRAGTTAALPNGRDISILGQNNAPALDDIAWYGGNSSVGFGAGRGVDTANWPEKQYPDGRAFAREVKGKQANYWGLYDMIGNVWEWCNDWYGGYGYGSATDPTGASSGAFRVNRGGSWSNRARYCRSAFRDRYSPGLRDYFLGFRVALAPVLPEEYRKAIQAELKKANVVTKHEQYQVSEVKRERQPEKKAVVSTRNDKGTHNKVQLWEGGPYWADRNVGAERPEDYGYHFWWGDTVGYKRVGNAWVASDGSSQNFSFGNAPTFRKDDATLKREGWITDDGVLAPEHDAARTHWGGSWRMPTGQELEDLRNKCDWSWMTMNGVNGYVVRGKGAYASYSIFLPCVGRGYGTSLNDAGWYGDYWSSVPYSDNYHAGGLGFGSSRHYASYSSRYFGRSVRPVQGFTK